jgi:hypothetical protein
VSTSADIAGNQNEAAAIAANAMLVRHVGKPLLFMSIISSTSIRTGGSTRVPVRDSSYSFDLTGIVTVYLPPDHLRLAQCSGDRTASDSSGIAGERGW